MRGGPGDARGDGPVGGVPDCTGPVQYTCEGHFGVSRERTGREGSTRVLTDRSADPVIRGVAQLG